MSLYKSTSKRPIILLFSVIIVIIGLFIFSPARARFKQLALGWVLDIQLNKLDNIQKKMQRNYMDLQQLALQKAWDGKFALFKDKQVSAYFGPESENRKLLLKAQKIATIYGIKLEAQFQLLTYYYKEQGNTIVGFVGFDCGGINYSR